MRVRDKAKIELNTFEIPGLSLAEFSFMVINTEKERSKRYLKIESVAEIR
jgi:hypothetical protein